MTVVTTSIMMLIPNKRMYRNAPSSFRSKRTKVYKKHTHTPVALHPKHLQPSLIIIVC